MFCDHTRSKPFRPIHTRSNPFEPIQPRTENATFLRTLTRSNPYPFKCVQNEINMHSFSVRNPFGNATKCCIFIFFYTLVLGSQFGVFGGGLEVILPTLRFNDRSSESERILWQLLANKPLFKWATTRGPNVPADPCHGGSGAQPWSGQQSPAWGCGARPEWRVKPCGNTSPPLTPASAGVKVCPPPPGNIRWWPFWNLPL